MIIGGQVEPSPTHSSNHIIYESHQCIPLASVYFPGSVQIRSRKEIVGKGWRDLDWFVNVGEGVGVDGPGDVEDELGADPDVDVVMGENGAVEESGGRRGVSWAEWVI